MRGDPTTRLAGLIVVGTGVLWGFYWLPVRRLAELGLPGAWGTLAIVAAAVVVTAPPALRRASRLAATDPRALAGVALGGVAFALYSIGFVYGRVAIVILLFFLTPVWSTLIARLVLGRPQPALRVAAIGIGLAGLAVMLAAGGEVPLPRSVGEWLALASGLLWAIASTLLAGRAGPAPAAAAFVFALGATLGAAGLAPLLAPWPAGVAAADVALAAGWAVVAGGLWWGLSMASLLWATARLEPARVGILLMSEVLVGTLSAALLAGEQLAGREVVGGALVLAAGVLEIRPVPATALARAPDRGDR
jgi:drug/metabolite transporter (DMT)-like permease